MRRLNTGMVVFSAGAAFLACSLLLACGMVSLVAFNLLNPNPQSVPTRSVQNLTRVALASATPNRNATGTPDSAIPTLLPTLPPPQLPATTGPSTAPEQAVREYYALVSDKQFDSSWGFLSDDFKRIFNCCAPNYDYQGYIDWWNTVDRVEFGQLRTVSQNGDRAVVYAELRYRMKAGGVSNDREPYIELIFDSLSNRWLFDDKGPTSSGRR